MTVNDSPVELAELKAQLAQAKLAAERWKQLYKDTEAELEAKTERLLVCESDCDLYQKLYTETLDALTQEQADHIKTRDSLLKIIGDTITNQRSQSR
jgi:multidrug resistance efflux pump